MEAQPTVPDTLTTTSTSSSTSGCNGATRSPSPYFRRPSQRSAARFRPIDVVGAAAREVIPADFYAATAKGAEVAGMLR